MRTAHLAVVTVCACLLMASCKCRSDLGESKGPAAAGEVQGQGTGPLRWCRACAVRGFTACKRVDGQEPEETLRRKAEITACKDVGLTEEQCTPDVLRFTKCGVTP